MKDTRHDPSTPASDEALLSWHAEAEFQAWRNQLESVLINWSTAPEALKPALLLAGPDLTRAEGWLHSRRGDISRRQQAFIRASIQNRVAAHERESEVEQRKYSSTLSWWVSFTATISATCLLLLAEFVLFSMWRGHGEVQDYSWRWWVREAPAGVQRPAGSEPAPPVVATAEAEPDDKPEIRVEDTPNGPRMTAVFKPRKPGTAPKPSLPSDSTARPAPTAPAVYVPPPPPLPVAPRLASPLEIAGQADVALRSGDAVVATLLALETLAGAAPADAAAREAATLVLYRLLASRQPIAAPAASPAVRTVEIERGAGRAIALGEDGSVRLWDLDAARELLALNDAGDRIGGAAVSRDGASLAIPAAGDEIRLWNAGTGRMTLSLKGHEGGIAGMAFSPDRRLIASASQDQTGRIWDAGTGRTRAVLKGHGGQLRSTAFSADGRRLVTTAEDQTARIWNAETGSELAVLRGHAGEVTGAAFSSDGRRVLTTSVDGTARLWDAESGRTLAVISGSHGPITSAELSPSGARIASIAAGKVTIWDGASGNPVSELRAAGSVRAIAFTPDARVLLAVGWSGEVALFDIASGERLALLNDAREPVLAAALSADGRTVIAVGVDRVRIAWPMHGSSEELAESARDALARCLTADERRQFLLPRANPAWCARFEPAPVDRVEGAVGSPDAAEPSDSPF